ncbi:MAG: hypothetical protein KDE08_10565 [Rhodobacteraceae bacterium]|nr:hypothetical protein [Paracoccaceae bacterium]
MSQLDYSHDIGRTGLDGVGPQLGIAAAFSALMARWHGRDEADVVTESPLSAREISRREAEKAYLADIGMAGGF